MAFLKRNNSDDLLFPMDESGQLRYNRMRVLILSGANAASRMAQFIREYTNRDGTQGLPPNHIGATSPYIDGGNMFYIYFQDNAEDPHNDANFPTADGITHAAAEAIRADAIAANNTLIAKLQGSDTGWRTN
jgi:hypothetical protein